MRYKRRSCNFFYIESEQNKYQNTRTCEQHMVNNKMAKNKQKNTYQFLSWAHLNKQVWQRVAEDNKGSLQAEDCCSCNDKRNHHKVFHTYTHISCILSVEQTFGCKIKINIYDCSTKYTSANRYSLTKYFKLDYTHRRTKI